RAGGAAALSLQAEDGIRDRNVTGVQTCALPICPERAGVDVVEADAHAATSCASSTVIMTRAMLGRSSGAMKIRDRPLVIARTVMESLSGSLHRAVLATTGRGLVVSCMS